MPALSQLLKEVKIENLDLANKNTFSKNTGSSECILSSSDTPDLTNAKDSTMQRRLSLPSTSVDRAGKKLAPQISYSDFNYKQNIINICPYFPSLGTFLALFCLEGIFSMVFLKNPLEIQMTNGNM